MAVAVIIIFFRSRLCLVSNVDCSSGGSVLLCSLEDRRAGEGREEGGREGRFEPKSQAGGEKEKE